ncbi:MAG: hypothetical protein JWM80_6577, partial [Cyanobacteria bacterium RYN_339]|nr:hypothetical protein [Cyanobacteria bacterium RYN_339]
MKRLPICLSLLFVIGCQGKVAAPGTPKLPVGDKINVATGLIGNDGAGVKPPAAKVDNGTGASLITNDGGSISGAVRVPAGLITNDGGSLITNDGGSLITNDGGSLITNDGGSLITNDGGSLITNDGGSIVAQGGGNLRLFATSEDAPLKGAVVGIFDAAGRELPGPDGKP